MAKLTSEEREILINALVENEAIEEDDREMYEGLKDENLISFADAVLNADGDDDDDADDDDDDVDGEEELVENSDDDEDDEDDDEDDEEEPATNKKKIPPQFLKHMKKKGGKSAKEEDEEDEEEPATNAHVCNKCAGKMKGKKGKPAPEEEDDEEMTGNAMTDEEWFANAPPGIASVVANAMNLANEEKARLIEQMTCNLAGSQKTAAIKALADHTLNELKILAPIATKPAQAVTVNQVPGLTRRGNFSGAGNPGGVTTNKKGQASSSEPLIMPTINFAELSKEFADQNN